MQRNLVYVVGLAMDICYEDVLRGSEFFGQFGKPIKVSYATGFALSAHHVTWDAHPLHIHAFEVMKLAACRSFPYRSRMAAHSPVFACTAGVCEPQHAAQRQRRQERSQRQRVRHLPAATGCAAVHRDH